jgi:hypothetical protein
VSYPSAQLPAHSVIEPLTLAVAGSTPPHLKMVKPTGTMDALLSKNRFAALSSHGTSGNQNPPTLNRETSAVSGAASLPLGKSRWWDNSENSPGLSDKFGHLIVDNNDNQGKKIRDRSNSTKRKNSAEDNSNAKSARIEVSECPHLKALNDNSKMISKVLESLADHTGTDPVVAGCVKSLAITMNSMNDVLGVVMAEHLNPGSSPEVTICETIINVPDGESSKFPFPPQVNNPRKPLKQKPLGDTESWATAVSRQTKRQTQSKNQNPPSQNNQTHSNSGTADSQRRNPGNTESPFVKAVKEAERSLLVFNLDMGQSPIMNPTTISAKVTVGLLNVLSDKEKAEGKYKKSVGHSQASRDLVDDIISQVVRMEFFGSKTAPCKFPGNSDRNGEFFTVPVKLMFKDRKIAQTAAEILRKYFNIQPTTPYHRSLRAAITQAINRAKEGNPGYHAKVNVDLNGRTLKCFVREDTKPPGVWKPLEGSISLPSSVLDPGLRDMSKVILPTSPNDPIINSHGKTKATDNRAPPVHQK